MKKKFNPSAAATSDSGIFGIPTEAQSSLLHLLPVPWEVTTSYGRGASLGPQLILKASEQIDLFDLDTGKAYEKGFHLHDFPTALKKKNDLTKRKAQEVIRLSAQAKPNQKQISKLTAEVNKACEEMTSWVYKESQKILKSGKLLGLIGGDHSTPWGAIQALCEFHNSDFGVLHIDAHADLRKAYQGFTQSHASIMYNVMTHKNHPQKLVQVGIRDFCEEEYELIQSRKDISTFFDRQLKDRLMSGHSWDQITKDILKELPNKVYVSFDIDGLDPIYCPNTGTPVPGGLDINQVFYLFKALVNSGRQIIGFDVNEVSTGGAPLKSADEWDGNVGARVLYKLCGWTVAHQPRA